MEDKNFSLVLDNSSSALMWKQQRLHSFIHQKYRYFQGIFIMMPYKRQPFLLL